MRFLAAESREQGWSYFTERFGGGYYRAEATTSKHKIQGYSGGSPSKWFHFPGPSKPFPVSAREIDTPRAIEGASVATTERERAAAQLVAEWSDRAERERARAERAEAFVIELLTRQHSEALERERAERERATKAEALVMDLLTRQHAIGMSYAREALELALKIHARSTGRSQSEADAALDPSTHTQTESTTSEHETATSIEGPEEASRAPRPATSSAAHHEASHHDEAPRATTTEPHTQPAISDDHSMKPHASEHAAQLVEHEATDAQAVEHHASSLRDDEPTATTPAEPCAETYQHRRVPPMIDPPGMISIRTARGWITIPKTWIGSHVLPEDQAKFERLLRTVAP